MIANNSEELHAFAKKIGMHPSYFLNHFLPHYNFSEIKLFDIAVKNGAEAVSSKTIIEIATKHRVWEDK